MTTATKMNNDENKISHFLEWLPLGSKIMFVCF